jgi:hypothetical protein
MFDEASEVFKNPEPQAADEKRATKYRRQALELYKEALSGGPGLYAAATGDLAWKLKFQLARLYSDLAETKIAEGYWKDIYKQEELKELRREAAMRLAEAAESGKNENLKEAYNYYQTALDLCGGNDTCSYVRFKRAWLLHNQMKNAEAISEMEQALWDSKGQVREEALRDYVTFLAQEPGNGERAILLLEPIVSKLARPKLIQDLMEEYFSHGNKVAGTNALEYVHAHNPQLKLQVRLLEETYGRRNWERFRFHLEKVQEVNPLALGEDAKDTEKLLRRLLIQLDGERITKKEVAEDFKTTTLLYLKLFPTSNERFKMQEGWLAAETEPQKKMDQLKIWIADPIATVDQQIKLREHRVSLAQKLKQENIVVEEMAVLAQLVKEPKKKREYEYLHARSLYELKDYAKALPEFIKIATFEKTPDSWAIKSQNLILDIYNQQKNYDGIVAQADTWLKSDALAKSSDKEIKKELSEMLQVKEQAEFEKATSLGQNALALSQFKSFCEDKKFLPKSCENTKILAVQLKDQKNLLWILKHLNQEKELAAEYEASGYFTDAAKILEKSLNKNSSVKDYLKVALLYELGNDSANQLKILKETTQQLLSKKTLGEEEELLYQTFKDANYLEPVHFKLGWNEKNKAKIANALEVANKGIKETQKLLLQYPYSAGSAWEKLVFNELETLANQQKKLGFYGKKAEKKFNARIDAIKALSTKADFYLPGSEPAFRVKILALLTAQYEELTNEIINSPIPAQLDPESIAQIKQSLQEMAKPFSEKTVAYKALSDAESKKLLVAENTQTRAKPTAIHDVHKLALSTLHENPQEEAALKNLKSFYESNGQNRLAAYFEGRIQQLQKEEKKS